MEETGVKRKRSIKDRLEMDKRVVDEDVEENEEEEAAETFISEGDDDSEIEWTKKRKRPRRLRRRLLVKGTMIVRLSGLRRGRGRGWEWWRIWWRRRMSRRG